MAPSSRQYSIVLALPIENLIARTTVVIGSFSPMLANASLLAFLLIAIKLF